MKKIFFIGLLLLSQYTCDASEDHLEDKINLDNYKIHTSKKTGGTIFYPKEYENYKEFKADYITNLLKERLEIFINFKKAFDDKEVSDKLKKCRHLLDINTIVLSNNLNRELRGKIFGETYDNKNIKAEHILKITSVLQERLSDETEKEKLNLFIQHFKAWNDSKEKTLVLEGPLLREIEKVEETNLPFAIPTIETDPLQKPRDTPNHIIEKDDKIEMTLEDQMSEVQEVFNELAKLVELESIHADDIDCKYVFPATEKESHKDF